MTRTNSEYFEKLMAMEEARIQAYENYVDLIINQNLKCPECQKGVLRAPHIDKNWSRLFCTNCGYGDSNLNTPNATADDLLDRKNAVLDIDHVPLPLGMTQSQFQEKQRAERFKKIIDTYKKSIRL